MEPDNSLTQAMRQKSNKEKVVFNEIEIKRELDAINFISNDSNDYIPLETNKKNESKYSRSESSQENELNDMSRAEKKWVSLDQPARKRGDTNE